MNKKPLYSIVLATYLVAAGYLPPASAAMHSVESSAQPVDKALSLSNATEIAMRLLPSSGDVTINRLVSGEIREDRFGDLVDALISELEYSAAKRVELAKVLYHNFENKTLGTSEILDSMGDVGAKPTESDMLEALDSLIINGGTEEIASLRDAIVDYFTNVINYINNH